MGVVLILCRSSDFLFEVEDLANLLEFFHDGAHLLASFFQLLADLPGLFDFISQV